MRLVKPSIVIEIGENAAERLSERCSSGTPRSKKRVLQANGKRGETLPQAPTIWRMSGHPAVQSALRNHYFNSLGLP